MRIEVVANASQVQNAQPGNAVAAEKLAHYRQFSHLQTAKSNCPPIMNQCGGSDWLKILMGYVNAHNLSF